MNIKKRLFFSKKLKLLNSYSFQNVFKNSKKFRIFGIVILHCLNNLYHPRLGLIVSKKVSKFAHKRNSIKRLIRESFRLIQHYLIYSDFVIIVTPNILKIQKNLLKKKIENIWKRYFFKEKILF